MNYEERFALAESRSVSDSFTRIDDSHPVDMFLGLERGQRALMVLCPNQPPIANPLKAIALDARLRNDGRWALVLRLLRPELKPLFTRLVEDLDYATRQQPDDPGTVIIRRLLRWQRLLSQGSLGLLDDKALRGLCAELHFLLSEAIPAVGASAAAAAWRGPYDAPKDFVFQSLELEVKAVRPQAREYCISSLEQLSNAGKPLFLWACSVDLVEVSERSPQSPLALVERLREACGPNPLAVDALERGLQAAGFEDRPEYGLYAVALGQASCFRITEAFPRLQRAGVPAGITSCEYTIAATSLEPFRVESWREVENAG